MLIEEERSLRVVETPNAVRVSTGGSHAGSPSCV